MPASALREHLIALRQARQPQEGSTPSKGTSNVPLVTLSGDEPPAVAPAAPGALQEVEAGGSPAAGSPEPKPGDPSQALLDRLPSPDALADVMAHATLPQLRYVLGRCLAPHLPRHRVAIAAGYASRDAGRRLGQVEGGVHVAPLMRWLQAALEFRGMGLSATTVAPHEPTRAELSEWLYQVLGNPDADMRARLDAAKQLRELLALDVPAASVEREDPQTIIQQILVQVEARPVLEFGSGGSAQLLPGVPSSLSQQTDDNC